MGLELKENRRNKMKIVILICMIVLILLAIVSFGGYLYNGNVIYYINGWVGFLVALNLANDLKNTKGKIK